MNQETLPDGNLLQLGSLPDSFLPSQDQFETIWSIHPEEYSEITIVGKRVKVPRWDQAYEKDYPFANQVAEALPAPDILKPFLIWAQANVDARINGMFVNWHDGQLSHYHGKHRDSTQGLVKSTPIITVSLGEERIFRVRPYPAGKPRHDFILNHGDFIVIPWQTNQHWTHEVPKFAKYKGRRISVTMRAFET